MALNQAKRTPVSLIIDQALKLAVVAFFVLWMLIPGVLGWLEGQINTGVFESFIFADDEIGSPVSVMISMARMVIAVSVFAAVYRNDVSKLLGLELYGPRMLARLLFAIGAILYVIAGFVAWQSMFGGF